MFRSDLDAALQRADALQRELDVSRAETDQLQRELVNARARITSVESADALQRQLDRVLEQLTSTQQLLVASENERRRLEALVPPSPVRRVKRTYANSAKQRPHLPAVGLVFALVTLIALAFTMLSSR
jgi:chromosome segregation ATPase